MPVSARFLGAATPSAVARAGSGQAMAIDDLIVIAVMSERLVLHHQHSTELVRKFESETTGRVLANEQCI
ncbi:MAG: hypothetical protein JKY86_00875 [Gammaproteobacteria bacterium]|nr:hypothetical protein [Gammaproteobacteria bacterium]